MNLILGTNSKIAKQNRNVYIPSWRFAGYRCWTDCFFAVDAEENKRSTDTIHYEEHIVLYMADVWMQVPSDREGLTDEDKHENTKRMFLGESLKV